MAVYGSIQQLKNAITDTIYENSAGLITASILQDRLFDIIDTIDLISTEAKVKAYLGAANDLTNIYAGLNKVATQGWIKSYLEAENDLTGIYAGEKKVATEDWVENNYVAEIPMASGATLGGIKVGENLTIEEDGTLNANAGSDLSAAIEIKNKGLPNEYLNIKMPLACNYGVQVYSDNGQFPPSVWAGMPYATDAVIGGIIYDSSVFEKNVSDQLTIKSGVLVPAAHNHDDRYFTESEVTATFATNARVDGIEAIMSTDTERLAAITALTSAYQEADESLNDTLTEALVYKAPLLNPIFSGSININNAGVDNVPADSIYFSYTTLPNNYRNKIQSSISSVPAWSKMIFSLSTGASTFADVLTLVGDGHSIIEGELALKNSAGYAIGNSRSLTYFAAPRDYGINPLADIKFSTTGDSCGAQIEFMTRSTAADYATRMTIGATGYVGVGGTPLTPLHVFGNSSTAPIVYFGNNSGSGGYGHMGWDASGMTTGWIGTTYNNNAAEFQIRMKGTGASNAVLRALGSGTIIIPGKLLVYSS